MVSAGLRRRQVSNRPAAFGTSGARSTQGSTAAATTLPVARTRWPMPGTATTWAAARTSTARAAGGFTAVATDAMATAASGCWRRHNANAATRPATIRASQCAAASSCSRISGLATASTSTSGRRCAGLRSQTATATSTKARAATRCRASRAATSLGNPVAALLALHLVAALALVLVAVAVCDLSPAHRRPLVLVLAVANPLILLQLLAAAHWEALMVAGLVAALALWRRQHPLAAVAMASVATALKPPAALAVLVLAAAHVVAVPAIGQRVRATGKVVAAAALPWVLLAPLVPNAAGFLPALSTPLAGRTLYAPTTLLAEIIAVLGHVLGVPVHFDGLLAGTRVLGLALAAVVTAGLLLTWRRPATTS